MFQLLCGDWKTTIRAQCCHGNGAARDSLRHMLTTERRGAYSGASK